MCLLHVFFNCFLLFSHANTCFIDLCALSTIFVIIIIIIMSIIIMIIRKGRLSNVAF